MAYTTLGEAVTFTAVFVDGVNDPLTVTSPLIDIFYFDSGGDKQALVTEQAMTSLGSGHYVYFYTPVGLSTGVVLVGFMRGTSDGVQVSTEQSFSIRSSVPLKLSR